MKKTIPRWLNGLLVACPLVAVAGPPYVTDDPVPVEYRHWEVYLASQHVETRDGWAGTAPHVEINYGAVPNLQLHLIAPLAYSTPRQDRSYYGYGDTELGAKYRFFGETGSRPQVGVFPLLEVPTGNSAEGLGGGHLQAFLPVWVQKDFGSWTVYGGSGYGINPGSGNRNWGFFGVLVQNQIRKNLAIGGEFYHQTSTQIGEPADTAFNLGTVYDFTDHYHLLFSAGRSVDGPTDFQTYIAFQLTFGPNFLHRTLGTKTAWAQSGSRRICFREEPGLF